MYKYCLQRTQTEDSTLDITIIYSSILRYNIFSEIQVSKYK